MPIRPRGRGTWEVTIELGRDPVTNKRRRSSIHVKGTKRDAQAVHVAALHKRDTGIDISPAKMTVAAYLERWLSDYAETNVARSTFVRYQGIVRQHLIPAIGPLKLRALRPNHVQAAYADALRQGLAPRTVLQHHHVLREALHHAVRWQLVAQNVAEAVTPPKPERFEMRALTPDEAGNLLAKATDPALHTLILVALETGMRQGELLALRWADVDLNAGAIHITRSARYYTGEGIVSGPTKTHRSRRQVALATSTISLLREHKRTQNETRLAHGPMWTDHDLIFAGPHGDYWPARDVYRLFKATVDAAKLAPLRFHDLRHTAATLALRAGVNPKMVSERLGHATVAFTLDTYSHVLPDMQRDAAEALSAALRRTN